MAFENLFIRTKKSIGGIQMDSITVEDHTSEVELTKNPVEVGANVTDHAIIQPKRITIKAVVSDTPLGLAALGAIVDTVTGLFGSSTSDNETRSRLAYSALIQLQETREPIEIQTGLKLYENMILTSVVVVQDKDTSRIIDLAIEAEEVILVSSVVIEVPEEDLAEGSPQDQAASAIKKGRIKSIEPPASTETTVLKKVSDWVLGP